MDKDELRQKLDPATYRIVCECGTEPPFTGRYWDCTTPGVYHCVVCEQALFDSDTKYDSRSGWPSYYQPVSEDVVTEKRDLTQGMVRTVIVCSQCQAHLGHVFEDCPAPTGLRYCINSASLLLRER